MNAGAADDGRAAETPPEPRDPDAFAPEIGAGRGWGDYVVPAFIFLFCAAVTYVSLTFEEALPLIVGHSMQPRVFPIFLMAVIAILNLGLIIYVLRNPPKERAWERGVTWASAALMLLFWVVTEYVDMMVALVVTMFLLCIVWGERRLWVAALVAFGTTIAIFFTFDQILEVRFPRGLLTDRYYG